MLHFKWLFVLALTSIAAVSFAQTKSEKSERKSKATAASSESAAASTPTSPAQRSAPDVTTEAYGDWIMKCQTSAEPKRCEVSQTIVLQGQQSPIALIAVGREKADEPLRLVSQLPNNVSLRDGVKAFLQNGEVLGEMKFTRCLPVGCFAEMTLSDASLTKFKAQTEPGVLKFKDGLEREIALPLSLRGFGPAIDALSRS